MAYMATQFGILARLTWWEYSWDIMEPVTYFITYGTAMAMYAYFVLTRQVRLNKTHQRPNFLWLKLLKYEDLLLSPVFILLEIDYLMVLDCWAEKIKILNMLPWI